MKHRFQTIVAVVYWLGLTLWVALLVSAGVAAAGVFSTLPKAGVTLERFLAYDRAEHGRLAAGMVMEPIFAFVDIAQAVAATMAVAALLVQLKMSGMGRTMMNWVRTIAIAAAFGLFAARVVMIAPTMNHELRAYWAAAESGNAEAASINRASFDRLHPVASRMFNWTLALLLVGVAASAAGGTPRRDDQPPPTSLLQPPQLLHRQ